MGLLSAVKAVALAADPSSLPVAELVHGRGRIIPKKNMAFRPGFHLHRLAHEQREGQGKSGPKHAVPPGGEVVSKGLSGDLLQRGEGFAKLADGGGYLPCSQPVVGD
jgi:hypothetical protein